jgi:hypothetical protein
MGLTRRSSCCACWFSPGPCLSIDNSIRHCAPQVRSNESGIKKSQSPFIIQVNVNSRQAENYLAPLSECHGVSWIHINSVTSLQIKTIENENPEGANAN